MGTANGGKESLRRLPNAGRRESVAIGPKLGSPFHLHVL